MIQPPLDDLQTLLIELLLLSLCLVMLAMMIVVREPGKYSDWIRKQLELMKLKIHLI
jgi:hypothetical protein